MMNTELTMASLKYNNSELVKQVSRLQMINEELVQQITSLKKEHMEIAVENALFKEIITIIQTQLISTVPRFRGDLNVIEQMAHLKLDNISTRKTVTESIAPRLTRVDESSRTSASRRMREDNSPQNESLSEQAPDADTSLNIGNLSNILSTSRTMRQVTTRRNQTADTENDNADEAEDDDESYDKNDEEEPTISTARHLLTTIVEESRNRTPSINESTFTSLEAQVNSRCSINMESPDMTFKPDLNSTGINFGGNDKIQQQLSIRLHRSPLVSLTNHGYNGISETNLSNDSTNPTPQSGRLFVAERKMKRSIIVRPSTPELENSDVEDELNKTDQSKLQEKLRKSLEGADKSLVVSIERLSSASNRENIKRKQSDSNNEKTPKVTNKSRKKSTKPRQRDLSTESRCSSDTDNESISSNRPKRAARPTNLKVPSLKKKLRR